MKKLKAIFFGTPDIAIPSLEELHNHQNIDLNLIVTMPDRPAGRGKKLKSPEVAEFAKAHNINLLQTPNINKDKTFCEFMNKEEADFIIVFAFAQFLNESILNFPSLGCFNIHTSLLPKYRGAAPIQYALLNGDKETGVSIQKMVKKMDAGDIVTSSIVNISDSMNASELYQILKIQAVDTLKTLIDSLQSNKIEYKKQDEEGVSFAPTIKKEDGKIDFENNSMTRIVNKLRAFDPWPGIFCFLNDKRLKIFQIEAVSDQLSPGETSTKSGKLIIGCKDSSLRLKEIQLEGKKRSSDIDLLNGLKGEVKIN